MDQNISVKDGVFEIKHSDWETNKETIRINNLRWINISKHTGPPLSVNDYIGMIIYRIEKCGGLQNGHIIIKDLKDMDFSGSGIPKNEPHRLLCKIVFGGKTV